jgi:hypothetical protein
MTVSTLLIYSLNTYSTKMLGGGDIVEKFLFDDKVENLDLQ